MGLSMPILLRTSTVLSIFLFIFFTTLPNSYAQDNFTVIGSMVNGSSQEYFEPTEAIVTLRVLEGTVVVDQSVVQPDDEGKFTFKNIQAAGTRNYFFSVEYQGAIYSETRQIGNLTEPLTLTVYNATTDPNVLDIVSHTIIITGIDKNSGVVEILERVSLANTSGDTLVPQMNTGMLGFLRFALPANSSNLDVRSNLVGGQLLQVDRGFAVTTPIPPTEKNLHNMEFIYRLPYKDSTLDISRTLRFGAGTLRVVIPAQAASGSSINLTDLGTATFEGQEIQLLEGQNLAAGVTLDLKLSSLPEPFILHRLWTSIEDEYVAVAIPLVLAIALIAALLIGIKNRPTSQNHLTELDFASQRKELMDALPKL